MARADQNQIDLMRKWFQSLEDILNDPEKDAHDIGKYIYQSFSTHRISEFERILFGYETLVTNVCDLSLSYLEFKPEILAAMSNYGSDPAEADT